MEGHSFQNSGVHLKRSNHIIIMVICLNSFQTDIPIEVQPV